MSFELEQLREAAEKNPDHDADIHGVWPLPWASKIEHNFGSNNNLSTIALQSCSWISSFVSPS